MVPPISRRSLVVAAVLVAAGCALAWIGYRQHVDKDVVPVPAAPPVSSAFHCDGRLRCSEMRSCAEAKFFLKNCPGTQQYMDIDQDRLPCEQEWCPQE